MKNRPGLQNLIIYAVIALGIAPYTSVMITNLFTHEFSGLVSIMGFFKSYNLFYSPPVLYVYLLIIIIALFVFTRSGQKVHGLDVAGQGQFGTTRFMTDAEKKSITFLWNTGENLPPKIGGVVFGKKESAPGKFTTKNEQIYIDRGDEHLHTLILGTTGSGKSRKIFFPTIWTLAQAGESMIINDTKGDLFLGTHEYLDDMGYATLRYSLRDTSKDDQYNNMDIIISKYERGDYDETTSLANELARTIIESIKPVNAGDNAYFYDGATSCIAAVILLLIENAPSYDCKNIASVQRTIAYLGESEREGLSKLKKIMRRLPETSLARIEYDIANLAPAKTEGSILSTALVALSVFKQTGIAQLTCKSTFKLKDLGRKPVALFIETPDNKPTRHVLTSIMITQAYSELVELATENGNVLPVRVNFLIDEFAALPRIMDFDGKMSRGRSYGMRFYIAIQDLAQLEKHYNERIATTIRSQATNLIYLNTTDNKTSKYISERVGEYTIRNESKSNSARSSAMSSTVTEGSSLTGRALMKHDEIQRIKDGESLVLIARQYPAIFKCPDLSEYQANNDFGMGDKEHNRSLFIEREAARSIRHESPCKIWVYSQSEIENHAKQAPSLARRIIVNQ